MSTIGFVGGGNMAEALVRGIVAAGVYAPENVLVSDRSSSIMYCAASCSASTTSAGAWSDRTRSQRRATSEKYCWAAAARRLRTSGGSSRRRTARLVTVPLTNFEAGGFQPQLLPVQSCCRFKILS